MEYREYRAESVGTDDDGKLVFLVTPFGRETVIGDMSRGGFKERSIKGSFVKTLDEGDPIFCYQHDLAKPLARKSAGNLDLREGELDGTHGVVGEAVPVDTTYAQDLRKLIDAKVIRGMSFGFEVVKDAWFDDAGNPSDRFSGTTRELREVRLIEVSAVTRPAYGGTSIMARDAASALLEERQAHQGTAPEVTVTGTDYTDMAAQLIRLYNELPEELKRAAEALAEQRAADITQAHRMDLAKEDKALPDGSYPIPDVEHLHSAAVLAASGHGDVAAAKALIRKRAKELGVELSSLPGFGTEKNAEPFEGEERDDPDGKEYAAMRRAIEQLDGDKPDVAGAIKTLRMCLPQRSQEPDTSTPEHEESDQSALRHRADARTRWATAAGLPLG